MNNLNTVREKQYATCFGFTTQEVEKGRSDIILRPRYKNLVSYVFELKYGKEETNLDEVAKQAIEQIQER